ISPLAEVGSLEHTLDYLYYELHYGGLYGSDDDGAVHEPFVDAAVDEYLYYVEYSTVLQFVLFSGPPQTEDNSCCTFEPLEDAPPSKSPHAYLMRALHGRLRCMQTGEFYPDCSVTCERDEEKPRLCNNFSP
ncbi:hypothetical protein BG015_005529, partial [Linnemannia schmuckeri]